MQVKNMRKICVVTGTRAEYGLLQGIMEEIQNDPCLELQLVVTGMHLSPEFGLTYKLIEKDHFVIHEKVEMLLSSDTPVGIGKSLGLGVIGFSEVLNRLKPDVVLVLGDRFEILAAVQAAMIGRIPVAHISGGEVTEGVIDESIRHAITKMSHLHFVGAEEYRNRVIQLGEQPRRVFNVGDLGIDNIERTSLLSKIELEQVMGFSFGEINSLVTYHPVTLKKEHSERAMKQLLAALDSFPKAKIIFTKPNADTDGRVLIKMVDDYVHKNSSKAISFISMGQINYLSAMKYCDVVIGNSSSGLTEAPFMKKATVNIGERQSGRLKAGSVIDCGETSEEIYSAIRKALSNEFQKKLSEVESLYGNGNASKLIKKYLKECDLSDIIIKKFYDIKDRGTKNECGA